MKKILHFSDIHFGGPQAPNRAEALLSEIERQRPDVVALSGDLTQRARSWQFRQARAFLDRINLPLIVVPGNHDVPLWNVVRRFASPLEKYKRWITADLNPTYLDDQIAVLGIDTTRSFTIKGGGVDGNSLGIMRARFCPLPEAVCKVIVAHHPFAQPPGFEHEETVGGLERALNLFDECRVDMVLTGHLHQSYIVDLKSIYPRLSRSLLLVQAGTVASLRGRGAEALKNSYNLIEVSDREIKVTVFIYSEEEKLFLPVSTHTSERA